VRSKDERVETAHLTCAVSGRGILGKLQRPLAAVDAAIAARGDLASGPISKRPGGAYDAKIASHAMVKDGLSATAIAGPTADDQPCFSWTGEWATQISYPHYGHPTVFNFSWLEMRGVVA